MRCRAAACSRGPSHGSGMELGCQRPARGAEAGATGQAALALSALAT